MNIDNQKTETILIRVTPAEKAWIKAMAKLSGITVTAFLLTKAYSHVFVSPLIGRQLVQLMQSIYFRLQELQSKEVNIGAMQDALNNCTCLLRNHMNALKTFNGGD